MAGRGHEDAAEHGVFGAVFEDHDVAGALLDNGINGKPAIRFSEDSGISLDAGLDPGDYTVFIIYQRDANQTGGPDNQRLLSVWNGTNPVDLYRC